MVLLRAKKNLKKYKTKQNQVPLSKHEINFISKNRNTTFQKYVFYRYKKNDVSIVSV